LKAPALRIIAPQIASEPDPSHNNQIDAKGAVVQLESKSEA
jgi:hypothetical protein